MLLVIVDLGAATLLILQFGAPVDRSHWSMRAPEPRNGSVRIAYPKGLVSVLINLFPAKQSRWSGQKQRVRNWISAGAVHRYPETQRVCACA